KTDIDAIAKAYEIQKAAGYIQLQGSNFASGSPPKDPSKGDYFNWLDSGGAGFKACASLEANPSSVCNTPAANCYCKFSTQGNLPANSTANTSASTQYLAGMGGSSSSSCDTNGTLLSGLVGYWKMDENLGTTTADSSGNGNTGTLNGGYAFTTSARTNFGNTGLFNGTDAYVNLGTSAILSDLTDEFTVSAWVKTSINSGFQTIVSRGNDWRLWKAGNYYEFQHRNTSNNISNASSPPNTSTTWIHVVGTFKKDSPNPVKLYVDGVEKASANQTGTTRTIQNQNYIGANYAYHTDGNYNDYWFNGQIDDVRIYNRALSGSEITALNGTPPGSGCFP
ncbi:LamG domain-containing protein, partial [Candidatus Daviesbacteria bacterium]|nr:LamG domain-containing protein [Candidatus Daviesbacteria bacterium]